MRISDWSSDVCSSDLKVGLRESTTAEIETDLRAVQVELEDLRRQLTAAEDALARTRITAPEAGRVYGLRFHTHGGVVAPGDPILNLVPDDEEMIVLARLDPNDIDAVREGAQVSVRRPSFNQLPFQPIAGTVVRLAPVAFPPDHAPPYSYPPLRPPPGTS